MRSYDSSPQLIQDWLTWQLKNNVGPHGHQSQIRWPVTDSTWNGTSACLLSLPKSSERNCRERENREEKVGSCTKSSLNTVTVRWILASLMKDNSFQKKGCSHTEQNPQPFAVSRTLAIIRSICIIYSLSGDTCSLDFLHFYSSSALVF